MVLQKSFKYGDLVQEIFLIVKQLLETVAA